MTFVGSVLWIAFYSYIMVWWANTIGVTLGIPTEVMGLTVLAAGTSIPDLITRWVYLILLLRYLTTSTSVWSLQGKVSEIWQFPAPSDRTSSTSVWVSPSRGCCASSTNSSPTLDTPRSQWYQTASSVASGLSLGWWYFWCWLQLCLVGRWTSSTGSSWSHHISVFVSIVFFWSSGESPVPSELLDFALVKISKFYHLDPLFTK